LYQGNEQTEQKKVGLEPRFFTVEPRLACAKRPSFLSLYKHRYISSHAHFNFQYDVCPMDAKARARKKVAAISKRKVSSAIDIPVWSSKIFFDLNEEDRATILHWHGKVSRGLRRLNSYIVGYPEGIDALYTIRELWEFIEDVNIFYEKLGVMRAEIVSLYYSPSRLSLEE
jgi:hypothetical protein